jgi:hypothetical protein
MSDPKPVELVVYRQARNFKGELDPNVFAVNGFWTYRPYDAAKRLTDAELAAEYWMAFAALNVALIDDGEDWRIPLNRMNTLNGFATHDHYDEEQDDD